MYLVPRVIHLMFNAFNNVVNYDTMIQTLLEHADADMTLYNRD